MPVGTRSLLYGVHAFWLHPFAVALTWWKLYGFPWDPRLWIAFIVHDWGYWGSSNMDGLEGKMHPYTRRQDHADGCLATSGGTSVLYHSRHYAKILGKAPSKLCAPDKLASAVYPTWLYLILGSLTGEIYEYMRPENCSVLSAKTGIQIHDKRSWFKALKAYLKQETRRTATHDHSQLTVGRLVDLINPGRQSSGSSALRRLPPSSAS